MTVRDPEEVAHERAVLDAAHTQNEAGRDAFVALSHTALFAASIAFVGDVTPINEAIWKPALIAGWTASVAGLLALCLSFGAARRSIDARRTALWNSQPPENRSTMVLNAISLWSFPVALLCLFSFATANVMNVDAKSRTKTTSAAAEPGSEPARHSSGTPGAEPGTASRNGGNSGTAGSIRAGTDPATSPTRDKRIDCRAPAQISRLRKEHFDG